MLKLVNLNYGYTDGANRRSILQDCSYTFEDGRFYTILGPSGSGKTTLLFDSWRAWTALKAARSGTMVNKSQPTGCTFTAAIRSASFFSNTI